MGLSPTPHQLTFAPFQPPVSPPTMEYMKPNPPSGTGADFNPPANTLPNGRKWEQIRGKLKFPARGEINQRTRLEIASTPSAARWPSRYPLPPSGPWPTIFASNGTSPSPTDGLPPMIIPSSAGWSTPDSASPLSWPPTDTSLGASPKTSFRASSISWAPCFPGLCSAALLFFQTTPLPRPSLHALNAYEYGGVGVGGRS